MSNRCPHAGGSLEHAAQVGLTTSTMPGEYSYSRQGEIIRCPWHGWEFDVRTGHSYAEPDKIRTRTYPMQVEEGRTVVEGPYVAEKIPVKVEETYIVVDV